MHRDLVLMLLADARLPVAGHTQSGGLEPAVRDRLLPAEVPTYARTRLATVTAVEAGAAVIARHLLVTGATDGLRTLEEEWDARSPSPALRDASRRQARALVRLVRRLWPHSRPLGLVTDLGTPPRPLVLGALAAELGLESAGLARLVGYDDVQTVCAASLKLLPLDPAEVTAWVVGLLPAIGTMADSVADLTCPDSLPATGNPSIETWAQAHALTTRRLFHA